MPRFTKLHIDALPAHAKAFFVWNDQMKGFGARVYPYRLKPLGVDGNGNG